MTINNRNNKARLPPVGDGVAAADAANNTTPMTSPSNPFCIRLDEKRSLYRRKYDDGLDWLRQPSNDLPAGAISLSTEVGIPTPSGSWRTVSPDELRRETEENRLYDGRYEGQPDGDPLDRSIHSSSGLSMRSTRNRSNNDNNDNTSDLKV
jgi:hypothetical protein